ncbi:MAG: hypothetical protein HRU01_00240 [Myxococcales bacterium]|nr:hypothetical protein [Myxococcales bacterium]
MDSSLGSRSRVGRRRAVWRRVLCAAVVAALGCAAAPAGAVADPGAMKILKWKQGFRFRPPGEPELILWYWFYEWNLFGAVKPRLISKGLSGRLEPSGTEAGGTLALAPGLTLHALPVFDGIELSLTARNQSARPWPELASVIPCLSPQNRSRNTPNFVTKKTWFFGEDGLELVVDRGRWRAIHFNRRFRPAIDARSRNGRFPWSRRWRTSSSDAERGILVRESVDGEWVMGAAWERFLSAQANNSSKCLHLSVRIGPLAVGESRVVRGKLYLLRGSREDLLKRYEEEFGSPTSLP